MKKSTIKAVKNSSRKEMKLPVSKIVPDKKKKRLEKLRDVESEKVTGGE